MIENPTISVPFSEVEEAHVSNYLRLPEMFGEFLIIQKPGNTSYSLYTNNCDTVGICQPLDWYIVSKDTSNDRSIIGTDLPDKGSTNGELYRVQDETTFILWHDILHLTFESDFVRRFSLYNTHLEGKMRVDGALCFYIHDYYPTECKNISASDRKTSSLVSRFKEGRQIAFAAKIFSFCIAWMSSFKEKAANTVLIPILAATRKRNLIRFARFCSPLSRRFKAVDGSCATWIREDRGQMKGTHGQDKLSNLIFHPDYFKGRDVFLVDNIISSGENFTQMKCKLIQFGAKSVIGLFLGKTVKSENQK